MLPPNKVKDLVREITTLDTFDDKTDDYWKDAGANVMIYASQLTCRPESLKSWMPKAFELTNNICLIKTLFIILGNLSTPNFPFENEIWDSFIKQAIEEQSRAGDGAQLELPEKQPSFYDLALGHCCAIVCLVHGEGFKYVQTLLIHQLFNDSDICSLLASDIYTFIARVINPIHKSAICQIIMNICKIAPPRQVVKGAALINRITEKMDDKTRKVFQYKNRYPESLLLFLQE